MNTITKNATLITGLLIFLGYCQYHFYYHTFGIEIYTYISTTELLLSFLPVIVSYFIPIALFIYFIIISPEIKYRATDGTNVTKRMSKIKERRKPKNLIKYILFSKRLTKYTKLKLFLLLITNPVFISFCILIYLTVKFWILVREHKSWGEGEGLFYLISLGWLIFIIEPFFSNIASESLIGKRYSNFHRSVTLVNYFLILTYFIYFSQKISAWKKLDGEVNKQVQVKTNSNEVIKTDSCLLFIGQTSNYIFFRNKKDSSNLIISNSEVQDVIISSK